MKCCSSGIHTLRRRVCQRGQAQGHRSATTLRAGQRPPCAVRHAKRRWHAMPVCCCVRGRSPCAKLLPQQRRSARARAAAESAPVPPLVRLHVAPLVLAVLGALVAHRLGLRRRRARVARQRTWLAGACVPDAAPGAASAAPNASLSTVQRSSDAPPRAPAAGNDAQRRTHPVARLGLRPEAAPAAHAACGGARRPRRRCCSGRRRRGQTGAHRGAGRARLWRRRVTTRRRNDGTRS